MNYNALIGADLIVHQVKNRVINNLEYMEELLYRDSLDLLSQTQKIQFLENKVSQLAKLERNYIAFEELTKEVKVNYENIEQFSYSNEITSNFTKLDTLSVFTVKWNDSLATEAIIIKDKYKLERWLKVKLNLDTLVVKRVN